MKRPFSQPIGESRRIEWNRIQMDNARLALASWDPHANLAMKLAQRRARRAIYGPDRIVCDNTAFFR